MIYTLQQVIIFYTMPIAFMAQLLAVLTALTLEQMLLMYNML